MKKNAVLINAARGPVVDENALVQHLKSNPDFRVGLDVFEKEPKMADDLKDCDNAVLAPHIASSTLQSRGAMSVLATLNVLGSVENYPIWNKINVNQFLVDDLEKIPKFCPNIVNA